MREPCPCHGCTERFTACSDHCPKDERGEVGYKAWKERYRAQKAYTSAARMDTFYPLSPAQEKANNRYLKLTFNAAYRKTRRRK